MANPKFKVGQVFASVELLRKAIREYSCKERVDISMPTNDRNRVAARCAENCSWYMWASYDSRAKCFMIKRYVDEHTCERKWQVGGFTYKFLAEKYFENFRADTSRENLFCGAPIYAFCGAWVVLHRIFATKISFLWRTSTCATEFLNSVAHQALMRHRIK
jgi:hypothetical protein